MISIEETLESIESTVVVGGVEKPVTLYSVTAVVSIGSRNPLTKEHVESVLGMCTFPCQSGQGEPTISEDGRTLNVTYKSRPSLHGGDTHTREPFTDAVIHAADRLAARI